MRSIFAALTLTLSACSSQGRNNVPFELPAFAASHEELIKSIPADLFRGDLAGENRANPSDSGEYLDFVFLKNNASDTVPMRVALYTKASDGLALEFVSATPFSDGDCRREECRARIALMPGGFQISLENLTPYHFRADYRFLHDGKDLKLIGRGFQVRNTAARDRTELCTLFFDYIKMKRLRKVRGQTRSEPLPAAPALHLKSDQIKFELISPESLCAGAPQSP